MKTKRLFENDSYLSSCTALVLSCSPEGQCFGVVLDQTVFFPEEGGQPCDLGFLGNEPVVDVQEKDGILLHYTNHPLPEGASVCAEIDRTRRFDFMQQHTGEHILSFCLWSLFGAENVGFHLGTDIVTIDIDRPLSEDQLMAAEEAANRQIFENRAVRAYYISPDELSNFSARKKSDKAVGNPRIVEIENGDRCTCCAPHVSRTGEVGCVKILRWATHKKGLRIELACGRRALADYRSKNRWIFEAGALLSTKPENISDGIRKLKEELSASKQKLKSASSDLMRIRAQSLWETRIQEGEQSGIFFCGELSTEEGQMLLGALLKHDKTAVFLLCRDGGRTGYLLGRTENSPSDIPALCALAGRLSGGRGGGKPLFCQGSAPSEGMSEDVVNNLKKAFSLSISEENNEISGLTPKKG